MERKKYEDYQWVFNNYIEKIHSPYTSSSSIGLEADGALDNLIEDTLKENGVFNSLSRENNWHNKFARFPYMDPYNALSGCREYIFFTRPDLNLLDAGKTSLAKGEGIFSGDSWDLADNDYLKETFQRMPYLFDQWTSDMGPFMNLITNSARSTLELPGVQSKDVETASTIYGSKITYRGTSWSSDEQFDFSVEFQDNKYLEVYNLFKIYDEYERLKSIGKVTPKPIYRQNRVIHDQFTAFKIVVGPDGREIIYWGRAVGCYPTTFPRDSFGNMTEMLGDNLKFTIPFKGHFARDLNPSIIVHFNQLSLSTYRGDKTSFTLADDMPLHINDPYYEIPNGSIDMSWAVRPLILIQDQGLSTNQVRGYHKPGRKYYLIWLAE